MSQTPGISGSFLVPGTLVHSVDETKLLDDAYKANLLTAQRHEKAAAKQRGFDLTDAEARAEAMRRYDSGDHSVLPQYHSIATRIANRNR